MGARVQLAVGLDRNRLVGRIIYCCKKINPMAVLWAFYFNKPKDEKMIRFSDDDISQITKHELSVAEIEKQLNDFANGFPFADIIRPATVNDGIMQFDSEYMNKFTQLYDNEKQNYKIIKFVPASGAATRMFRDLFDFLDTGTTNSTTDMVVNNITRFAFYDDLKKFLGDNPTPHDIISGMLDNDKLNLGILPKALIKFHKYNNETRTAAHEHLIEGAKYAESNGVVNIHFTLSPEHQNKFNELMNTIIPGLEQKMGVKFNITTSTQKSSTDTIAANFDNTPFRDNNGMLFFRPAGHGALIENLNEIDSDIVFIKNIDNITNDNNRNDTIIYKKLLAGILIDVQKQIFQFIQDINNNKFNESELRKFITQTLCHNLPEHKISNDEYIQILNRPIRVCGVVKNTGAPGGGPFWVNDAQNGISLQITESSQIAPGNRDIMEKSTHFNPVDLVCGIRDWQGKKFDLTQFIDAKTGFISEKSYAGKPLRAMERPGLWNGAMAYWHTIFVQVPNTTFTPVKKVSDLLNPSHIE